MKSSFQRLSIILLLFIVLSAKAQNYPDLLRTKTTTPKRLVLIIPDNIYIKDNKESNSKDITNLVTNAGYDAFLFTRSTRNESDSTAARDSALVQVLQLLNRLKTRHSFSDTNAYPMKWHTTAVLGIGEGGHLAARLWMKLTEKDRPGKLILVSPAYLNETIPGTVIPALMPPFNPHTQLLITGQKYNDSVTNTSWAEYAKTWGGYGASAMLQLSREDKNKNYRVQDIIKKFLDAAVLEKTDPPNPAARAIEGYARQRHQDKLELLKKQKYDLLFIGNSITNNLEKPEYHPVWQQFFAPRNAINLGYSGYRTENIIWNLQHGELDGQSPKAIILEIGTNNVDEKNYQVRHTASQLACGLQEIVGSMRQKTPDAKIILLRCFPGSYSGPNPTSHRAILERASDIVSEMADNTHVFYCDVNHVFLNLDGSINHTLMPDWLHPSPAGAKVWAQAMEPLLSQLMGDNSLDTEVSKNTAVVPVPKLEEDSYDWWGRHAEVLHIKDSINPEIILISHALLGWTAPTEKCRRGTKKTKRATILG